MDLQLQPFSTINLADPFFDSLKESYLEFCDWYNRKAAHGEKAYVFHNEAGQVTDFLYMKIETEEVADVRPILPAKRRLKVGTFKILPRHTRRGERFMKKIMDRAMVENVDEVYVTIFPKPDLEYLIHLFGRFGFNHQADKPHADGSSEWVMVKDMRAVEGNVLEDYPRMRTAGRRKWLLGIYPKWHTPLFPDSILKNESYDMVQDCTPTNGIYKIYISWNSECAQMMPGDLVVIYRSSDEPGRAWYRSVVSTICTVYETKKWWDFKDVDEFLDYTKYSVFDEKDRRNWFHSKQNLVVIKMLYNVAFSKRAIRKNLVENGALDAQARPSLLELTDEQFKKIIELGQANERYFID